MPVTVVSSENSGIRNAKVTVECDSVEQALGTDAKTSAIMAAKNLGLFRPGISGSSGPYPVNENGEDATLEARPGMKYRNDFNISEGV